MESIADPVAFSAFTGATKSKRPAVDLLRPLTDLLNHNRYVYICIAFVMTECATGCVRPLSGYLPAGCLVVGRRMCHLPHIQLPHPHNQHSDHLPHPSLRCTQTQLVLQSYGATRNYCCKHRSMRHAFGGRTGTLALHSITPALHEDCKRFQVDQNKGKTNLPPRTTHG